MSDRGAKCPLYKKISEDLRNRIISGEYKNDDSLPSERELSEMFKVERMTVRRALELLVKDGLIIKQAGYGSRVVYTYDDETPNMLTANNIAFILPADNLHKISEPLMASLFYCIETECRKCGFSLFVIGGETGNGDIPYLIQQRKIKAAMWVSQVNESVIRQALLYGIPSIALVNHLRECTSILIDNFDGAVNAIEHLLSLGHKKIAYISGIPFYSSSAERRRGYEQALVNHGIKPSEDLIAEGNWTFESGHEAMRKLLEGERPTAVFAANDVMALGAIKAIVDVGLSVPEDLSVVGFDDVEQAGYAIPPLTTVGADVKLLASYAIKCVSELIAGDHPNPVKIVLPTKLVVRESTSAITAVKKQRNAVFTAKAENC